MYTNGNFDAHSAALCFLGTLALTVVLLTTTVILLFRRRAWARYTLLAPFVLLAGYTAALGAFSWASYDRTVKRGDEKFFCGLDCHIAYSVRNVERVKIVGDATAEGEFVVVTVRSHFDERTIAPWRGNAPLKPDPPTFELVDANGRSFPVSPTGQAAWGRANSLSHSLTDPLRPGESYETTWVFDVPTDSPSLRLFARWHGFPSYLLIGDEASPGHRKTYLVL
jgi:hypothetical protein